MTTDARRLRPAENTMAGAVAGALDSLALSGEDQAAARLARHYAECIDAAEEFDQRQLALAKLGPALLSVLESLGATPAARARVAKGVPSRAESRLNLIREARR